MTPKTALVLCGGLGTRLRPAIGAAQKTLAEVGGVPFLERIVSWAARGGVERVVLCAGYRAESVAAWARARRPPPELVVSEESEPLGTAGALRLARPLIDDWPVLVLNGDSFCPVDLSAFSAFHSHRGGGAALVAAPAGGRRDGGRLSIGPDGRLLAFDEKPEEGSEWINAGIYIFEREAFDAIAPGRSSLETDLMPRLLGVGVHALRTEAPVWDIGTPERLEGFRRQTAEG